MEFVQSVLKLVINHILIIIKIINTNMCLFHLSERKEHSVLVNQLIVFKFRTKHMVLVLKVIAKTPKTTNYQ